MCCPQTKNIYYKRAFMHVEPMRATVVKVDNLRARDKMKLFL